ncbi:hypothetical protein [Bacillus pseudomycoides]|uniref:hypothetical protein n=3 Tax=Bacillus pseudomycoides TaxID=64104 RepID=UPI0001A14D97|nr:hypothetical protein [Bacillus pseudomycoides]EEM07732.1 hypothetical protein bmyco0003_55950 [Bacillus pseudomycoides]KFN09857.1 hypothetical protein DJ94_5498 [Bacillus pseudomycoides]MDR4189263.1 hypothetical protein [Bacillus pseudomycoides]MED0857990.1 hypothetical protein [Bacillus pseudomycoides]
MYQLQYRRWENRIELVTENGLTKLLTDNNSSKPLISPYGLKAIYLSPFEWETLTNLYVIDLNTGDSLKVVGAVDEKSVPKDAIWINDIHIALIIGYAFGVFSDGGNIYIYNLLDRKMCRMTEWNFYRQATKLEFKRGLLRFEGIEYLNNTLSKSKEFQGELDMELYLS